MNFLLILMLFGAKPDGAKQCTLPVMLATDYTEPEELLEAMHRAAYYWNRVTGKKFFFVMGREDLSGKYMGLDGGFVPVMSLGAAHIKAATNRTYAVALTAPQSYTGKCIGPTSVVINEEYIRNRSADELDTVMRHELGHALGLSHSRTSASVMFPDVGGAQHPKRLSDKDIAELRKLYP